MLKFKRILEYRKITYGFHRTHRVKNKTQAIRYVNERGYVFFWPINGIELPSLWGAVSGDRPVPNDHDDPGHVTWNWKDSLLGKHIWFYGKILRKRATIISMEVAPYFYALSENYGSPEEDYLTIYERGRMTQEAKSVYEALLYNGPLDAIRLRKAAHLTSREGESRFSRALTDLQADFKIMPTGVVDAGAWHYSFEYDIVARYEPVLMEKARYIGDLDAREKIIEVYINSVGVARIHDVSKLLGWKLPEIEETVDRLIGRKKLYTLQSIENQTGNWIVTPGLYDQVIALNDE